MISRFLILSAIAFSTIAAQNNNSELIKSLVEAPTGLERLQRLADKAFVFDFGEASGATEGAGGFSASANVLTMPATIGEDISLTVGYLGPCGYNTPHTHPRSAELNYVADGNGTFRTGFIAEDGARFIYNDVRLNEATIFPRGAIHFEYNPTCYPITFVAAFSNSFPGVNVQRLFGFSAEVISAALGIDQSDVENYAKKIPDNIAFSIEECVQRCGLNSTGQPTKQLQGAIPTQTASSSYPSSTSNKSNTTTSNGSVKGNLDSVEDSQNNGLTIGLIVAIAVMGLGYIALAAFVVLRRRKSQRGGPRDYVRTGESFAPSGMHDSEKYESHEPLRTPYDPPSGSR